MTASVARRYGAAPLHLRVAPERKVGFSFFAQESAVEGCVRETFGALLAHYQADYAQDPVIARVMRQIAVGETRHAALAWEVAAWAEPRLPPRALARVRSSQREAVSVMRSYVGERPDPALARLAGLPNDAVARKMLNALDDALWALAG